MSLLLYIVSHHVCSRGVDTDQFPGEKPDQAPPPESKLKDFWQGESGVKQAFGKYLFARES